MITKYRSSRLTTLGWPDGASPQTADPHNHGVGCRDPQMVCLSRVWQAGSESTILHQLRLAPISDFHRQSRETQAVAAMEFRSNRAALFAIRVATGGRSCLNGAKLN
jgi:hypothetical protein